jgi:flagellar basal body-associated protein FliL
MALWSDDDVELRSKSERGGSAANRGATSVKVLAVTAAILAIVLAVGSVYSLAAGTRQKKLEREAESAQVAAELKGSASYTGIGTVRARSADPKSAVVVATIAFPFDSGDRPFAEELGRKAPVLRAAAVSVLSAKKAADLAPAFEGALKAALRDAFNARLSLGKVTEVWLSDFAVIQ